MMTIKSGAVALALTAMVGMTSIVPVQAQGIANGWSQRDRVITTYCDRNPGDPDCNDFRRGRWSDNDYNRFYRSRRGNLDNIASGIFGFTFGAIIGGALANQNNNRVIQLDRNPGRYGSYQAHVDACYARYRSYDEETDSFMGFDGVRRRCNL